AKVGDKRECRHQLGKGYPSPGIRKHGPIVPLRCSNCRPKIGLPNPRPAQAAARVRQRGPQCRRIDVLRRLHNDANYGRNSPLFTRRLARLMATVSVNADRYASLEYQGIYLRNEWGDVLFPDLVSDAVHTSAEMGPLEPDELIGDGRPGRF